MSRMADYTKFILWLLLFSGSSSCFGSELDVQCLKSVQQSVNDPNGILKSSWVFDDDTAGSIYDFTGVECWYPDENRIFALRLSNLGLEGQFPQGLTNCTDMAILDLSSNNFSGHIPSDIAWQLPSLSLEDLDLSYNSFSGEIPVGMSNMTNLNSLRLQHNQLSGQIPWEFNLFTQLTDFDVSSNQLSGSIPSALQVFSSSAFAGNQELCGAPLLSECGRRSKRINDESSIGAAAGFVVGFVVAFYFPNWFLFCGSLQPYIFRVWA